MLPGVFVNGSNIQLKRIPFEFLFGCVEITTCGKTLQITPTNGPYPAAFAAQALGLRPHPFGF
jgi:hypothetical protein